MLTGNTSKFNDASDIAQRNASNKQDNAYTIFIHIALSKNKYMTANKTVHFEVAWLMIAAAAQCFSLFCTSALECMWSLHTATHFQSTLC